MNIKGTKHKPIGIKDNRVIFQRMEGGDSYDRKNPSFKIYFDPDRGYYIMKKYI